MVSKPKSYAKLWLAWGCCTSAYVEGPTGTHGFETMQFETVSRVTHPHPQSLTTGRRAKEKKQKKRKEKVMKRMKPKL